MISIYKNKNEVFIALIVMCCTLLVFYLSGCSCNPKLNEASVDPQYFCSGENVNFHWSVSDVDNFEVLTAGNIQLFSSNRENDTKTHGPMDGSMLPLQVRGSCEGETKTKPFPAFIACIDYPSWTDVYTTIEPICESIREEEIDSVSCEIRNDEGELETVEVPVVRVYAKHAGYTWRINSAEFSDRARVAAVKNCNDYDLRISSGGFPMQHVGFQSVVEAASPDGRPGGIWTARFTAPRDVCLGTKVQAKNCIELEYEEEEGDDLGSASIRILVVCKDAT